MSPLPAVYAALALTGVAVADEALLRVGTLTELEPLTPTVTPGFWYVTARTGLVHQPLLTTGEDGRLAPCLARRWEVAADNRSLTFHLHPQARWHDARPVTAGDVAFTLDYIREHQLVGQLWRFYDTSDVVDDTTVVVHFRAPVAYYQSLMFAIPPVLPRHVWESVPDPRLYSGDDALIGSGVFAFHAWDIDARVAYLQRRQPTPAVPDPPIDRVEIRYFSSPGAMTLALRQGQIDVVMGAGPHVPAAYIDAVVGEPGLGSVELESTAVPLTLMFHGRQWPTRELAFRQAIALAVDSRTLIATVLRDRGRVPGLGFVPPEAWTYAGPFDALHTDRRRAADLLDSLGFVDLDDDGLREDPRGETFVLPLIPETWQSAGEAVRAAELLVHQLRQVGLASVVDKRVVDEEYALLWEERDYLVYVGHTTPTSTRDGGHVYFADYADFSYGTFRDSAYVALLDRITGAAGEAEYLTAVAAAQRWNSVNLPGLALAWGTRTYAWRQDRFDDWSPVAGFGLPSYASWETVRPVAPPPEETPRESRRWPWIAAAVALVFVLLRVRRRR